MFFLEPWFGVRDKCLLIMLLQKNSTSIFTRSKKYYIPPRFNK